MREIDDVTALKIQYIENLQRDDVHPLDEADGYARLIAEAGYTVEQLAGEVGKSASYIYQRLKLSSLVPEARELFVAGMITAGHAILIARLGPEQQRIIVNEMGGDDGGDLVDYNADNDIASVRELGAYIQNEIMMKMDTVTWALDDAELLPEAGACRDCAKRTGYNPELFADVCKIDDGVLVEDYCTDRSCFGRKRERVVEVKRAELAGQDVVEVADGWIGNLPKNVVERYNWRECKAKTPGARKVLVVAGSQPGRVTYGVIEKSAKNTGGSRELEEERKKRKEKEAKEAAKRKAAEIDRVKRIEDVLQAAAGTMPLEALRICMGKVWWQWNEQVLLVAKAEGLYNKDQVQRARRGGKAHRQNGRGPAAPPVAPSRHERGDQIRRVLNPEHGDDRGAGKGVRNRQAGEGYQEGGEGGEEVIIYIASSWRNQHAVEMLATMLEVRGHIVVSFVREAARAEGRDGMKFDIDEWISSEDGKLKFDYDAGGAMNADLVIYIGPSGQDAAAECGMAYGRGVPLLGLHAKGEGFGLMRRMFNVWCSSYLELLACVDELQ